MAMTIHKALNLTHCFVPLGKTNVFIQCEGKSTMVEKLFPNPALEILAYQKLFGNYGAKYFV